jgi:Activator of Hsp90 ATPase homolog 1-like protein
MEYTNRISTSANKEDGFYAITNNLDKWWGKTDNSTSKIGDEFSIFFGDTEWRFKIKEYVPFEKITWLCIKANHVHGNLADIEKEWLNTELHWNFIDKNGETEISFTHKGLAPVLNCFDVCKSGWDYFISTSLKNYLETGEGSPHFD